jgi:thiol-disulfide isomerase/thioredoxin
MKVLILPVLFFALHVFGQTPSMCLIEGSLAGGANQNVALLNQNVGGVSAPIASVKTDSTGNFTISTAIPFPDYYYLRLDNGQTLNLVLMGNDSIKIYADTKNILVNSNIIGSTHSLLMTMFLREYFAFKEYEDSLRKIVTANPSKQAEVDAAYKPVAEKFYAYRSTFLASNLTSPALLAVLSSIDTEKEWDMYRGVAELLAKAFPVSPTISNVVRYVNQTQAEKDAAAFLMPGKPAKEIALPTINGDTLRLSDLRGKVVLIDFWASWCGPCRRENPNVVAMYKKYNADGFEVYSVSLDNPGGGAKWQAAITADGLIWPNHVSDLKGWACVAAKDYAVKGIPFTVLVDREGNIIATNVRGADLENQLKRIFGH